MKASELTPCCFCGKGVAHTGIPLFYRMTLQPFGLEQPAIQRAAGLEMMLNSVALARAMGPDEDIAKPVVDESVALVCHACAMEPQLIIRVQDND